MQVLHEISRHEWHRFKHDKRGWGGRDTGLRVRGMRQRDDRAREEGEGGIGGATRGGP